MKGVKGPGLYAQIVIVLVALLVIFGGLVLMFFLPGTFNSGNNAQENGTDRNYHFLVLGKSSNISSLEQVFRGADGISADYNTVVELYVPETLADDVSLEELFNYATFVNADGIIAYVDTDYSTIKTPRRTDGSEIPVITLGHYTQSIPQVSFIGTNYSELGRTLANECIDLLNKNGAVYLFANELENNPNYSNMMNSFQNILSVYRGMSLQTLSVSGTDGDIIDAIRSIVLSDTNSGRSPLLVCVTEEDTIRCVQLLSEFHLESSVQLLGMGNNETLLRYFERGAIRELVYIDQEKIGRTAMTELIEYRTTGHSNNYIAADVEILRGGK